MKDRPSVTAVGHTAPTRFIPVLAALEMAGLPSKSARIYERFFGQETIAQVDRDALADQMVEAARECLQGIDPETITHILYAHSINFPVPTDPLLIYKVRERIGSGSAQVVHLSQLNCTTGVYALELARQIIERSPSARILILTGEFAQPRGLKVITNVIVMGEAVACCLVQAGQGPRIGPSPLGIGAVLLELPRTDAQVEALQMTGMRTAGLGELRLTDAAIPEHDMLGQHLPPSRRGLWGMTRAFLRMRMQVASMALGAGSALLEEALRAGEPGAASDHLRLEAHALAHMVWRCAGEAEATGAEVRASLCKAACVDWATRVAVHVGSSPSGSLPIIAKLVRDVVGLEFMEGVGPKQRQIIAADWLRTQGVNVNGSVG